MANIKLGRNYAGMMTGSILSGAYVLGKNTAMGQIYPVYSGYTGWQQIALIVNKNNASIGIGSAANEFYKTAVFDITGRAIFMADPVEMQNLYNQYNQDRSSIIAAIKANIPLAYHAMVDSDFSSKAAASYDRNYSAGVSIAGRPGANVVIEIDPYAVPPIAWAARIPDKISFIAAMALLNQVRQARYDALTAIQARQAVNIDSLISQMNDAVYVFRTKIGMAVDANNVLELEAAQTYALDTIKNIWSSNLEYQKAGKFVEAYSRLKSVIESEASAAITRARDVIPALSTTIKIGDVTIQSSQFSRKSLTGRSGLQEIDWEKQRVSQVNTAVISLNQWIAAAKKILALSDVGQLRSGVTQLVSQVNGFELNLGLSIPNNATYLEAKAKLDAVINAIMAKIIEIESKGSGAASTGGIGWLLAAAGGAALLMLT
jgi:hypothetical protein